MNKILELLNKSQLEAVREVQSHVLILAGAGSGKTRTITSRLAYLIGEIGIDPANTLTLTFTNKAASEMRERALGILRKIDVKVVYPPLLCTFHKFGLLFLKFHIERLGRKNNFVVIDSDDKKRILKSFEIELPTSSVANEISRCKNSFVTPEIAYSQADQPQYKIMAKIYERYENYLFLNNLVDFDDLLTLTYQILCENDDICKEINDRYQYIMVDEYQDTNELQCSLLKKLCSSGSNICVVGDDDQSIYSWRGANVKNILKFEEIFDGAKVIKLEENYRSTKAILKAANDLIDHNRSRLGKTLRSTKGDGKEIEVIESIDEKQESTIIAQKIKKLLQKGTDAKNIAVLYRVNALSRSLEEGLMKEGVAYKMVGGFKFYERSEIKDLISYFRIIANPNDDFSFQRVMNKPKRGLGKTSIDKIIKLAHDHKLSIYDFIIKKGEILLENINKKSCTALVEFIQNIDILQKIANNSTYDLIDEIERVFKLREYYQSLPDGNDRVTNIDEFYGFFRDFIKQNPETSIDMFLNEISLQSDQDQIDGESIFLMSVHASKGLEFEHLFVIGLEEGFFPLLGDGCDIEEERRLGYVAITRAKSELVLCHSKSRFYRGKRAELVKSRFLSEAGLCEGSLVIEKSNEYKKGDLVKHKIFGMGRVVGVSKVKQDLKLTINFGGNKREIMASFVEKI